MIAHVRKPTPPHPGRAKRDSLRRNKLLVAGVVFVAFIAVAAIGYRCIQKDYTWLGALYMTVITVSTVGLREAGPHGLTRAGQAWTLFVIIGGVISGAVVLSLVVATLIEGSIRALLGRRQLERKIAALSRHVILCGYGRTGRMVARELQQNGRPVVVVDKDPQRTTLAGEDGMLYVLGDAQVEATLQAAGIERARNLLAILPDDAGNAFLTLSARGLSASVQILARAQEAATQDKLMKAGANRVICPPIIGANRITDCLLRPAIVDFVEMAHKGVDLEMDELTVAEGSALAERTLLELALPAKAGAMVVAVRRPDGTTVYNPGSETALSAGDTLILIGRRGMAAALERMGNSSQTATQRGQDS